MTFLVISQQGAKEENSRQTWMHGFNILDGGRKYRTLSLELGASRFLRVEDGREPNCGEILQNNNGVVYSERTIWNMETSLKTETACLWGMKRMQKWNSTFLLCAETHCDSIHFIALKNTFYCSK